MNSFRLQIPTEFIFDSGYNYTMAGVGVEGKDNKIRDTPTPTFPRICVPVTGRGGRGRDPYHYKGFLVGGGVCACNYKGLVRWKPGEPL